jgi:hypothetical protein
MRIPVPLGRQHPRTVLVAAPIPSLLRPLGAALAHMLIPVADAREGLLAVVAP